MMAQSFKQKWVHWIAILAILMSALAPSLSQAVSLAKGGQGFSVEICAADGSKSTQFIQTADDESSHINKSEHCPYCIAQGLYLLPTDLSLSFAAPVSNLALCSFSSISQHQVLRWVSLPSRAPPQS